MSKLKEVGDYHVSTYGFKGFEVQSSSGWSGVRCFKRLVEETISNGKLLTI